MEDDGLTTDQVNAQARQGCLVPVCGELSFLLEDQRQTRIGRGGVEQAAKLLFIFIARDEQLNRAGLVQMAAQSIIAGRAGEGGRGVHAGAQPQRRHQGSGRGKLVGPGGGEVPHSHGGLDPVEGGAVGGAQPAITGTHLDLVGTNAGPVEVGVGGVGDSGSMSMVVTCPLGPTRWASSAAL